MNKSTPIITLWQPWAQWIALGWKTVETRLHDRFKGLLGKDILIHCGQNWDEHAIEEARPFLTPERLAQTMNQDGDFYDVRSEVAAGRIIARANVFGFRQLTPEYGPKALIECITHRYGLMLDKVQYVNAPEIIRGKQGIWYL